MLILILPLILTAELAFTILLGGTLLIALCLAKKHRHQSASYELRSIRSKVIGTRVFDGVPKENPWLETLYSDINIVLLDCEQNLIPLPNDEACPPAICALQPELRKVLERLSRHPLELYLRMDARGKARNRLQREKARQLLEMIYRWASRARVNCSDRRLSETRSMVLRS